MSVRRVGCKSVEMFQVLPSRTLRTLTHWRGSSCLHDLRPNLHETIEATQNLLERVNSPMNYNMLQDTFPYAPSEASEYESPKQSTS
jgi:hypothetical protein